MGARREHRPYLRMYCAAVTAVALQGTGRRQQRRVHRTPALLAVSPRRQPGPRWRTAARAMMAHPSFNSVTATDVLDSRGGGGRVPHDRVSRHAFGGGSTCVDCGRLSGWRRRLLGRPVPTRRPWLTSTSTIAASLMLSLWRMLTTGGADVRTPSAAAAAVSVRRLVGTGGRGRSDRSCVLGGRGGHLRVIFLARHPLSHVQWASRRCCSTSAALARLTAPQGRPRRRLTMPLSRPKKWRRRWRKQLGQLAPLRPLERSTNVWLGAALPELPVGPGRWARRSRRERRR